MPNKNDCCVLKCLIRAGAPKAAIKKYTNKCYPQPETQQGLGYTIHDQHDPIFT